MSAPLEDGALLEVADLSKSFRRGGAIIKAVDAVSFTLRRGETLALVGPSGSGKSTIGRLILRLLSTDSGRIRFDGADWLGFSDAELRLRRRNMQAVFQNPGAAFNPRATIYDSLEAPLRIHEIVSSRERKPAAAALLERVGLKAALLDRYPHELSGGQKQRVAIARAVATRPKIIVLDEATSALDATVRLGVINLLRDIQREDGVAYLTISHDLALMRAFADRVVVLDHGRIVEQGDVSTVIDNPQSATARALVASALRL